MPPPSQGIAAKTPIALISTSTTLIPTPLPDLKYRQAATAPGPDVLITLSITRDTTTFTSVFTLGGGLASSESGISSEAPTTSLQSASASATTTVVLGVPGTTSSLQTATGFLSATSTTTVATSSPTSGVVVVHPSSGVLASVIVGAVLGGISGSLFVLFLIWFCCYSPYRPRLDGLNPFIDDGGTESSFHESKSRRSTRTGSRRSRYDEDVISRRRSRSRRGKRKFVEERPERRADYERERPPRNAVRPPLRDRDMRPLGRNLDEPDVVGFA